MFKKKTKTSSENKSKFSKTVTCNIKKKKSILEMQNTITNIVCKFLINIFKIDVLSMTARLKLESEKKKLVQISHIHINFNFSNIILLFRPTVSAL